MPRNHGISQTTLAIIDSTGKLSEEEKIQTPGRTMEKITEA